MLFHTVYLLLIIWIYLIINLITSIDFKLSFNRSIFFIRYPLLIMSMCYFFSKYEENISIVFKMWMVTLLVTIFDLYFQFFSGENLLGYKSPWEQRLSGFLNEELKVAHLLIGFFLPSFAFFFQKFFQKVKNGQLFLSIFLNSQYDLKKKNIPPYKNGVLDDNAHKTHFLRKKVVTINFFAFFTNFFR